MKNRKKMMNFICRIFGFKRHIWDWAWSFPETIDLEGMRTAYYWDRDKITFKEFKEKFKIII